MRGLVLGSLLALGIGGGFAPWIYRDAVALQLTAPGLAEYVKFLAESRLGLLQIQRLHFLLPLAVAMLSLPLVVVNQDLRVPSWLQWLLRLAVIPLALNLLSPVWSPAVLLSTEFRLQTMVAGLGVGLAVIAPLFKRLPWPMLLTVVSLLSSVALGLALAQFRYVNPAVAATYASDVSLGWGGWLSLLGLLGLLVATAQTWRQTRSQRTPDP